MLNRQSRRRRAIKAEINIVPFLDVLLVLLLIFMATAPVISQSVKVELPDAVDTERLTSETAPPVILEVPETGEYRLSIAGKHYNRLKASDVIVLAKAEFQRNPNTVFLVGGAKKVPYEEVINALNLLHQAGIKSVGLMTNPLPKKAK